MARQNKTAEEIAYEQQERWQREERKQKETRLASDWLHARKPDRRPKAIQIQKETRTLKDGQSIGEPKVETQWLKIPQIPGPSKGATRIPNDFPARVMAKISVRIEKKHPLSRRFVARDLDLKEDRLQRRLKAAGTTYRELVTLCQKTQGVD